ncbi:arylsulfatase [Pseudalgibacter alginicilyticus]|uniref:Arylsulfatase n=1 Tax=Pseudalgibacter alginicilyticus TaxID=1736674 RepID=A0A0P0DCP2_9FLAO|nr:arylsulfatase [Pseudalgibacter alginicilyticus]ALJ06732.1 arylsulfatase [Pseudalgibacter alginicilyticus]
MNKLFSVLLTLSVLLGCKSTPSITTTKPLQLPNIIYVLTDDLGIGDVSTYNPESKIKTPYIDKLASEGMTFTDAHTTSAVCTPSRYSILTGRYSWRTKLKSRVLYGEDPHLIHPQRATVASLLKSAGYYTASIGKWHLGWDWQRNEHGSIDFSKPIKNGPNVNGFDYSYGFCGSLDMPPYVYVENGKPTAIPNDSSENTDYQAHWRKGLTAPDFIHEEATPNFFERSFNFIKKHAQSNKPFFLYLPLPSPHTPILPTKEWQGKSGLNPYGDFVMMVDNYIGKLEAIIKESGIEENTMIVFTSDNGCSPRANYQELLNKGHNPSYIYRGTKSDIFEGGHRVPFIIKWPNAVPQGTICSQTISQSDLMATCASLTNLKLSDNTAEDSFNMLPLIKNPNTENYQRKATVHHSIDGSFAIRKGDWKYIFCSGSGGWSYPKTIKDTEGLPPFQLYNLKSDPGESNNLYGKYPKIENELFNLMSNYIKNGRSTPGAKVKNDGEQWWPQLSWMKNS